MKSVHIFGLTWVGILIVVIAFVVGAKWGGSFVSSLPVIGG